MEEYGPDDSPASPDPNPPPLPRVGYDMTFNQTRRDFSLSQIRNHRIFPTTMRQQVIGAREELTYRQAKVKLGKPGKVQGRPFSLAKMAYMSCSRRKRREYNKKGTPVIDAQKCCFLMKKPLKMMENAIEHNHLECFKLGHRNGGLNLPQWSCYKALAYGSVDILKYTVENGCDFILEIACDAVAITGHVSCLEYIHKIGGQLTTDMMNKVVAYGNLECLKYMLQHGCEWTDNLCALSAMSGNLEFVEYCRFHGCPWTIKNTDHWYSVTANLSFLEMERKEENDDLIDAMKSCVSYIERTADVQEEYKLKNYFGIKIMGITLKP